MIYTLQCTIRCSKTADSANHLIKFNNKLYTEVDMRYIRNIDLLFANNKIQTAFRYTRLFRWKMTHIRSTTEKWPTFIILTVSDWLMFLFKLSKLSKNGYHLHVTNEEKNVFVRMIMAQKYRDFADAYGRKRKWCLRKCVHHKFYSAFYRDEIKFVYIQSIDWGKT